MAGGPVAAVIAGITAAVSLLVKAFNDAKQRAKDAAEAIRTNFKTAFDKSSEAAKDFFDKLSKMRAVDKLGKEAIDFGIELDNRSKTAAIKKQGYIERSNAADDAERQKAAAKEKRDLALQQVNATVTNASVNAVKTNKARALAGKEVDAKALEIVQFEKTMKDMDKLLDKKLVDKYHELEDAVNKATSDVISKGKETTAFMAQQSHVTSSGTAYTTEYAVSYGEVLKDATTELNKFKKEHEEAIKDLDAYKEAAKKHNELKAQLDKLMHTYAEADQAAKHA